LPPGTPLFRSTDLGGGLRFHLHRTKAFKTVGARLVFHADLDGRTAARALVPRVLARGSRDFPSLRAMQIELDRLFGASLHGEARKIGERHTVQFRSDWVNDRLAGTDLLRRMASHIVHTVREPARAAGGGLRDEVVAQERKILADESRSVYDDKTRYARHRLLEVMCRDEAYARPSIGRTAEIEALTASDADRAHAALLARSPVDLFLVGDLPWGEGVRFARAFGFHRRAAPPRLRATRPRAAGTPRTVREKDAVTQAKLEMGFRLPITLGHPLYAASVLMNALFGGTPIGKLFKVVRERASLCYSIGSAMERSKGLLFVHAGIEAANYAKARRLILAQLRELQRGEIAPEAEEQARRIVEGALLSLRDSPGGLIDFALERAIQGEPADLATLLRELGAVKRGDIARAAKSVTLDTTFLLHG